MQQPGVQFDYEPPWLTGPLIAPSSLVLPYGHINLEPYAGMVANTGSYNNHWGVDKNDHILWVNSVVTFLQMGLTSWMDFQIAPEVFFNYTDGASSWVFGDLSVLIDIQLYNPAFHDHIGPAVKLVLKEVLPTGKYQHLDPKKKRTDIGGNGSFASTIGIVLGDLYHLKGDHFISLRTYFQYTFPSAVHLRGYNTYGGASDTRAKFFPAQNAQIGMGLEATMTKNWAFALDLLGSFAKGANYSGNPGTGIDLNPAALGSKKVSFQFSAAPAIEYNWNEALGIITGSWFSFAGKNASQFYSYIVAVNYYF